MKTAAVRFIVLFLTILPSGCQQSTVSFDPPRTEHYYISPTASFGTIGKVCLFEPSNPTAYPDVSSRLLVVLADEMGKRHLFAVQTLSRSDPLWKKLNLDDFSSPSLERLATIRDALGVDAVVAGALMQYRSYPHLQITMQLRMFDLRNGQVIWGIEDVWEASDKNLEKRIQNYYKTVLRGGFEPLGYQYILTSPQAFERFVAYETAITLPKQ